MMADPPEAIPLMVRKNAEHRLQINPNNDNDNKSNNNNEENDSDEPVNPRRKNPDVTIADSRGILGWWRDLTLTGRARLVFTVAMVIFFYFDIVTDSILAVEYYNNVEGLYDGRCVMFIDANGSVGKVYKNESLFRKFVNETSKINGSVGEIYKNESLYQTLVNETSKIKTEAREPLLNTNLFFVLTVLFMFLPLVVRAIEMSAKELLWHYAFHGFRTELDCEQDFPWNWLNVAVKNPFLVVVVRVVVFLLLPILIPFTSIRKCLIEFQLIKIEETARGEDEETEGSFFRRLIKLVLDSDLFTLTRTGSRVRKYHELMIQNVLCEIYEDADIPSSPEIKLSDELLKISENQFSEAFFEDAPQFVTQLGWTILDGSELNFLRGVVTLSSMLGLCLRVWDYSKDVIKKNPIRREPKFLGSLMLFLVRFPAILSRLMFLSVLFGSIRDEWRYVALACIAWQTLFGAGFEVWHLVKRSRRKKDKKNSAAASSGAAHNLLKFVTVTFKIIQRGLISNVAFLEYRIDAFDERRRVWLDEGSTEKLRRDPKYRILDQILNYVNVFVIQTGVIVPFYFSEDRSCIFDVNVRMGGTDYRFDLILGLVVGLPLVSIALQIFAAKFGNHPRFSHFGAKAIQGLRFYLSNKMRKGDFDNVCGVVFRLDDDEKLKLRRSKLHGRTFESLVRESQLRQVEKDLVLASFKKKTIEDFLEEIINAVQLVDESLRPRLLVDLSYFWDETFFVQEDGTRRSLLHLCSSSFGMRVMSKLGIPFLLSDSPEEFRDVNAAFFHDDNIWLWTDNDIVTYDQVGRQFTDHNTTGESPWENLYPAHGVIGKSLFVFEKNGGTYELNLETLYWTRIQFEGASPSPRRHHAGWVWKGAVYFFGGYGEKWQGYIETNGEHDGIRNNQIVRLDVERRRWESVQTKGQRPSPRESMGHCATAEGDFFIYGGMLNEDRVCSDELFRFNTPSSTWSQIELKGQIPRKMQGCVLVVVDASKLLLCGGSDYEGNCYLIYVESGESQKVLTLPSLGDEGSRGLCWFHGVVDDRSNKAYLFAGRTNIGNSRYVVEMSLEHLVTKSRISSE